MAWVRMRFKDQQVWVSADESGKPILDAEGRAEMKYRETDEKSYRPLPVNLRADGGSNPVAEESKGGRSRGGGRALPDRAHRGGSGTLSGSQTIVEIWTDGACSGNPGPMGIGVVVIDGKGRKEHGEYLGVGTNNIAELVAIERGLEVANAEDRRQRVYTDSAYAIGVLSKGWKAKANQELIARLRRRLAGLPNVEFVKVAGHAGVPENERCDELARIAINRRT
jgi:ribonuclease HI